jgi:hypothetical protein
MIVWQPQSPLLSSGKRVRQLCELILRCRLSMVIKGIWHILGDQKRSGMENGLHFRQCRLLGPRREGELTDRKEPRVGVDWR